MQRKEMSVPDLLKLYKEKENKDFDNDMNPFAKGQLIDSIYNKVFQEHSC